MIDVREGVEGGLGGKGEVSNIVTNIVRYCRTTTFLSLRVKTGDNSELTFHFVSGAMS